MQSNALPLLARGPPATIGNRVWALWAYGSGASYQQGVSKALDNSSRCVSLFQDGHQHSTTLQVSPQQTTNDCNRNRMKPQTPPVH